MKTKMISFILAITFITTAFDCNPDPITCRRHHTSAPLQELQGRYQSDDGYARLTLDTNGEYTLSLGDTDTNGNYRINEFSYVELHLITGSMNFEIHRNPNGQIVGLTEALNGNPVLHRMRQEEPFISYDNLDMEVIRQNLGRSYGGATNGQYTILELDNVHNRYSMDRDGQNYFGDYTIERTTYGVLLVLHVENRSESYYLHIIENSIERITSIHVGIEEGLRSDVPPIEAPPTNSNDRELLYGDYSSQDRLFGYYNMPNSFDFCRERLVTLFGRYESHGMDSISMIEITPDVMYTTINNDRRSINYTLEFRSRNGIDHSSIQFEIHEQTYRFELVIQHHNNTITGLSSHTMSLRKTQHYNATVTHIGQTLQITGGTN